MSYDNFTHGGCKVNKPAPAIPTRVQEVEAEASEIERIHNIKQHNRADAYERLARTLAAENTELRGKLDDVRMGIGCARGQRSTQYCADLTQRDATITALLEMLRPLPCENSSPYWKAHCVECGWCGLSSSCELERYEAGDCDVLCPLCHNPVDEMDSHDEARIAAVYRRACEIAGRTE